MSNKPNIILIMTDDQGPWALGCAGTPELRTPVLDQIAKEGMRFENFYCTSPVCSAARASILTGRIPSNHGVLDWLRGGAMKGDQKHKRIDPELKLDPSDGNEPIEYLEGIKGYTDYLSENGYVCGLSGKWHLGHSIKPQKGFDMWFACQFGGGPYYATAMIKDGEAYIEKSGYITDIMTDKALDFIDENANQKPFYLSVHYTAPHSPLVDNHPKELVDSYDACDFSSIPRIPIRDEATWKPFPEPETEGWRENLKGYFASITAVDMNVGRIFEKLKEKGIDKNTLVIFTSDNGFSCGHHGFWGKGNGTYPINLYDNSVKVPAIFWHPEKIPADTVTDIMVSQYDFMPTILEYAGLQVEFQDKEKLPGRSFADVLCGKEGTGDDMIVIYDEYGPVRMIRDKKYKYIHRYYYDRNELYDMKNDPGEEHNLIDDPSMVDVILTMRKKMKSWFAKYSDPDKDALKEGVTGNEQMDWAGSKGYHQWPEHDTTKGEVKSGKVVPNPLSTQQNKATQMGFGS